MENRRISSFLKFNRIISEKVKIPWHILDKKFCSKYNITLDDLYNRTYSVDSSDPVSLIDLLNDNADAVSTNRHEVNILNLSEYLPVSEIVSLEVGDYLTQGQGCDVKRLS